MQGDPPQKVNSPSLESCDPLGNDGVVYSFPKKLKKGPPKGEYTVQKSNELIPTLAIF